MKSQSQLTLQGQDFVDRLIAEHSGRPRALLTILEKVQERHPSKYLPTEVLEYVAAKTDIPLAQIHSVVTFFALFSRNLLLTGPSCFGGPAQAGLVSVVAVRRD